MASSTTEATESGIPMKITGRFVCWPKWDMEVAGVLNCRYLPDRYHLVESTVKMSWSEPNQAAWRVDGLRILVCSAQKEILLERTNIKNKYILSTIASSIRAKCLRDRYSTYMIPALFSRRRPRRKPDKILPSQGIVSDYLCMRSRPPKPPSTDTRLGWPVLHLQADMQVVPPLGRPSFPTPLIHVRPPGHTPAVARPSRPSPPLHIQTHTHTRYLSLGLPNQRRMKHASGLSK